jgi:putative flippase GtrA
VSHVSRRYSESMSVVRGLYDQFRVVIHEVAKFGIVGAFNAVLDIVLFNWLHFSVGIGPMTSKAASVTVAATSSYFMNRHWSFAHRARTGIRREYVLFIILSGVGLVIVEVCLGVTRYGLGRTDAWSLNIAANGVGLVLGTLWRFWSFKRWVFLPPDDPELPSPVEAAITTTT